MISNQSTNVQSVQRMRRSCKWLLPLLRCLFAAPGHAAEKLPIFKLGLSCLSKGILSQQESDTIIVSEQICFSYGVGMIRFYSNRIASQINTYTYQSEKSQFNAW